MEEKVTLESICCTPSQAWQWVLAVAEIATDGDEDGQRALGNAVEHYLQALRLEEQDSGNPGR